MDDPLDKYVLTNSQISDSSSRGDVDLISSYILGSNDIDQPPISDQDQQSQYDEDSFTNLENATDHEDLEQLTPLTDTISKDTEPLDKKMSEEEKDDGDKTSTNYAAVNNDTNAVINLEEDMEQGSYLHPVLTDDADTSFYPTTDAGSSDHYNDNLMLSYGTMGNSTQPNKPMTSSSIGIVYVNEAKMVDLSSWLVGAICVLLLLRLPYVKRFFKKLSTNQEPEFSELPYHSVPIQELD